MTHVKITDEQLENLPVVDDKTYPEATKDLQAEIAASITDAKERTAEDKKAAKAKEEEEKLLAEQEEGETNASKKIADDDKSLLTSKK